MGHTRSGGPNSTSTRYLTLYVSRTCRMSRDYREFLRIGSSDHQNSPAEQASLAASPRNVSIERSETGFGIARSVAPLTCQDPNSFNPWPTRTGCRDKTSAPPGALHREQTDEELNQPPDPSRRRCRDSVDQESNTPSRGNSQPPTSRQAPTIGLHLRSGPPQTDPMRGFT